MKMKEFAKKVTGREEKEKAKREEMLRMAMDLIEDEEDDVNYDSPFDVARKEAAAKYRNVYYYGYDDPTEAESLAYAIADTVAEKTAVAFLRMINGNRKVIVGTMLSMITTEDAESGAAMLKGMFYARVTITTRINALQSRKV